MLRKIFSSLNVKPEEETQVVLLLVIGFFQGAFLVTFQISAEALFLNNSPHLLKEAILVSGGLGMLTTAFFSFLQGKISFAKLAVGNLLLIFAITAAIYILYFVTTGVFHDYVIFTMFAMIGPFTAVVLLGFWGVFGRLFNLRQSKRIIGWIDTGQLTAAIITAISIPLLGDLIPDTVNFLGISGVSVLLAAISLLGVTLNYDLKKAEIDVGLKKKNEPENLNKRQSLFKDNYVWLLSFFLIFSMITFTFIQYSFQNVTALQYPLENELRDFLAKFHLGYLLLGFILQTFVNDKIIGVYGLKVALFILPIIVGFFALCSIIAGTLFGVSPIESPNTFIWFFLFISITRLFNYSLRDALENPTFKLFFMPLDNNTRFEIQTKVEGVVNETARMIAGGFILLLSLISFFELIHYSYVTLLLIGGYVYVIGKLYNQYRNKIKTKLENQQASSDSEENGRIIMGRHLERLLPNTVPEKAVFLYNLLEKINPGSIGRSINELMNHRSSKVREYAQDKMNEIKGLSVSDEYVIQIDKNSKEVDPSKKKIVGGFDLEGLLKTGSITKRRISTLAKSEIVGDRQYASELLGNSSDEENISFLIELLNDSEYSVRMAAINAAEKNHNEEIIFSLVENLNHSVYSNRAQSALVKIGGKGLTTIDTAFYRTGQHTDVMRKILQIYGRIGGNMATKLLWNKIDYPDKMLVSEALISLGDCGFKASISQISRIKFAIESDVGDIAWNLAATTEVDAVGNGNQLIEALKEENHHDLEHIYMLLGMLYEARSIQLVKENIESGTTEGVTYAIELLDVFLSEDLKQRIIPLIDDLSDAEKARKLEILYPRTRLDSKQVLKFLVNRDYNQVNRWSKTCAIQQIGFYKIKEYTYDVIANLFNLDKMVLEISAWALYQINPDLYYENIKRVDKSIKMHLDSILVPLNNEHRMRTMLYEKVLFLKGLKLFENVNGLILSRLADSIEEIFLSENDKLVLEHNLKDCFYIIGKGEVAFNVNDNMKNKIVEGEFIGEFVSTSQDETSNVLMANTETILYRIRKGDFYELLSDNISFAQQVVSYF
ncbi:MAG: cyclic nucleotide-binding domain-containing protein [Cyclobacteriaceae bacterium]|nr:cyclic nucleotide-binding domain-containing protein [Cyclobacteriaceae bacterium]